RVQWSQLPGQPIPIPPSVAVPVDSGPLPAAVADCVGETGQTGQPVRHRIVGSFSPGQTDPPSTAASTRFPCYGPTAAPASPRRPSCATRSVSALTCACSVWIIWAWAAPSASNSLRDNRSSPDDTPPSSTPDSPRHAPTHAKIKPKAECLRLPVLGKATTA